MSRKLGRKIGHRKSLMRNLTASLVLYEKVETTEAKAKELKSAAEIIIGIGKKQDLSSYRKLLAYFYDKNAAKKTFNELSKRYIDRQSGFVKSYHIGYRLGDNSKMIRLELVDRKVFVAQKEDKVIKPVEEKMEKLKVDKKVLKAEKKLEKLSATIQKGGVITSVRSKSTRKTGEK